MTEPVPLGYYRGDDSYGLRAAAEALGGRVGQTTGGELSRWRVVGSATSAAEIGERIATATLFGGGTLALVSEPGPLVHSRMERDALIGVLTTVAPGNALAFIETIDGSSRSTGALEPLRAAVAAAGGEVREILAPKAGQMAAWIEQRAKERSIRLGRGAAHELATRVGAFVREGDVDRRRQGELAVAELAKLALYRGPHEIVQEDVRALVAEAVPASTWAFLDAIGGRRVREASGLLDRLLESTPEPVLVVHLHRRIRELIQVADLLASGASPGSLVRTLQLKPFRAERLSDQARAWSVSELEEALEGLLEIDVRIKGADRVDVSQRQVRLAFLVWLAERVDHPAS
ncbi:MAG TPA: hypothetical protein VIV06_05690 [Candidatus Limnocylindrales bacterium]